MGRPSRPARSQQRPFGRALRPALAAAAVLAAAACPVAAPAVAQAAGAPMHGAAPKTTITAIEKQAMCVTCKIPLPEAQSPQATRERAFIKRQIAAGLSEAQVKRALVAEYGQAVLGLPSTHGFDLAAYIVPPIVVLLGLGALALLVPRWRRRAREAPDPVDALEGPALDPADVARLDQDLARFKL